jgi:hypothetical protein
MFITNIYKAVEAEDLVIKVGPDEVPDPQFVPDADAMTISAQLYVLEGKQLCNALCKHLPGGTLDQLLAELMHRRANLLRVPLYNKRG